MSSPASPASFAATAAKRAELCRLTKAELIERLAALESALEVQNSNPHNPPAFPAALPEKEEAHRLNQVLQQERNFISTVLDTVGALVVVLDNKGRIVRFNRTCEQTTGYSFDEVRGKQLWDLLLTPEEVGAVKEVFHGLSARKLPDTFENHWVARDGRRRLIAWSNTILTRPDGDLEYVIGTGIDITERKQEEAVRRELLARYEATFENAAIGIAHIAPDGRWLRVNQKLCEIIGFHREELLTKTFGDIIHPGDMEGDDAEARELLKGTIQSYTTEKRYVRKDGAIVWVNMIRSLMRDSEGGADYFIICISDISRRKQAEVALRETESRLEAIIDQAPVVVFVKDAEGRQLLVNQEFLHTLNLKSRNEVLGKTDFEIFPQEIAQQLRTNDLSVWGSGLPYTIEEELGPPFDRRTYLSKKFLLTDGEGRPSALCGIVLDITASKETADAFRKSEEHLRRVLDSMFAFVGVLSCDGTLLTANRAPLEAAGIGLEDVQEKKFWDCYWWNYSPAVQKQLRAAIARALQGEPSRYDVEVKMAGERMMSIDFMLAPMKDGEGRITHLVASAVDITDRKQLEREVLEVSAREQRRIGQDLHDDLCQRLTATEFLAHTLALDLHSRNAPESAIADKVATYTREAIVHTRHLARGLIPVNVTGGGLIAALRELALKSEEIFRITCRLKCPLLLRVGGPGTATHLYRIVQESISNAVRHGKATQILITLKVKESRVCLSISDNGSGIPQPLPKTDGMGLRIIQHRAGIIRATLEIRPGADGGTKVICTLPQSL